MWKEIRSTRAGHGGRRDTHASSRQLLIMVVSVVVEEVAATVVVIFLVPPLQVPCVYYQFQWYYALVRSRPRHAKLLRENVLHTISIFPEASHCIVDSLP